MGDDEELATRLRQVVEFCRWKLANYYVREDRTGVKDGFENVLDVALECLRRMESGMQRTEDLEVPAFYWQRD